jgi:hypothetical protein
MFKSVVFFPGTYWVEQACLLLPLMALGLLGRATIAPLVRWGLGATLLVALCTPRVLFNAWGTDFRLPMIGAMVLIGGLSGDERLTPRARIGLPAVVILLVGLRAASNVGLLRRFDADITQLRHVVASLPVGQRLLVVNADDGAPVEEAAWRMVTHVGMVALIDRDAYVPFLFTSATMVRVNPTFKTTQSPNAAPITIPLLAEGFAHAPPPGDLPEWGFGGSKYWLGWPRSFDYVLVTHFLTPPPGQLPPILLRVAGNGAGDLYRVAAR